MTLMLLAGLALLVGSLGILVLGWLVYPAITRLRAEAAAKVKISTNVPPSVSVVIATRESPALVASRIANLLANGYPSERLDILVAVDSGSTYRLADYSQALPKAVRLIHGDSPGGKACALNAAMRVAEHELVVFADSVPEFRPGAIRALVDFLVSNPEYGAVTGTLEMLSGGVAPDPVLTRLWQVELALRRAQASLHSVCVVTGCVYAIRRALWQPLPAGTICDDLFVPMRIIRAGYRVGVCDSAIAVDKRSFTRQQDFQRKVRTLTGMLQFVKACPWALVPGLNPVWTQFMFHKLLRIATPFLLLGASIGFLLVAIALGLLNWLVLALVVALVSIALFATLRPASASRVAAQISWSLLLLCAPLIAVKNAVLGRWDVWRSHAPAAGPT